MSHAASLAEKWPGVFAPVQVDNTYSDIKLLPEACGEEHWFVIDSPWTDIPVMYEMTRVSKLMAKPFEHEISTHPSDDEIASAVLQTIYATGMYDRLMSEAFVAGWMDAERELMGLELTRRLDYMAE